MRGLRSHSSDRTFFQEADHAEELPSDFRERGLAAVGAQIIRPTAHAPGHSHSPEQFHRSRVDIDDDSKHSNAMSPSQSLASWRNAAGFGVTLDERKPAWVALPEVESSPSLRASQVSNVCSSGVMGALAHMPLTEIVQSMEFGRKTAHIGVYFDDDNGGNLHVHDGQIVRINAVFGGHERGGEQAFVEMCKRQGGFFRIDYERQEVERNVVRPTTFVLLDALRVIDEAASLGRDEEGGSNEEGSAPGETSSPWGENLSSESVAMAFDEPSDVVGELSVKPAIQQHPRYRSTAAVRLKLKGRIDAVPGTLVQIGLGGAFVACDAILVVDEGATLCIPLQDGDVDVEIVCRIVHIVAPTLERAASVGVEFPDLPPEVDRRLKVFIEELKRTHGREVAPPSLPTGDRLVRLLAESELLTAVGDAATAKRLLNQAHLLAPSDDDIRLRLRHVNEAIDAQQANAMLELALRGAANAVQLARRATELRPVRDVLLRSLTVFVRAGAHDDIADTAEQLVELDPDDEGALQTVLDANVALKRWSAVVRAAEGLLKLRPTDDGLRVMLQNAIGHVRKG